MVCLECPSCGEKYQIETDLEVGRKVFCGRCRRKHIFYDSKLVPFACDLGSGDLVRRIACPVCDAHYLIGKHDAGEYACVACGSAFYASLKPEVLGNDRMPIKSKPIEDKPVPKMTFAPEKIEISEAPAEVEAEAAVPAEEEYSRPAPPPGFSGTAEAEDRRRQAVAAVTVKLSDPPVMESFAPEASEAPKSGLSLSEELARRLKKGSGN